VTTGDPTPDQREYRMAVLRSETPERKGLYSLNWSDGGEPAPGVVRTGLADALFWIQTMEQTRMDNPEAEQ
jgi:hypothetical protein